LHAAITHRNQSNNYLQYLVLLLVFAALPLQSINAEETMAEWNCTADDKGDWRCNQEIIATSLNKQSLQQTDRLPIRKLRQQQVNNPDEPRVAKVSNLDWMLEQDMSAQQKAMIDRNCCGGYIEPERDYPDADVDPNEASIRLNANSTEALSKNVALLEGDVQISQGYRQIRSNKATVDQVARRVDLQGDVRFREPGILLMGDSAEIDIDSKEVEFDNATYVLHENSVRGSADTLTRTQDGIIVINDSTYSTCPPDDNAWQLVTNEIAIDQNSGFATIKNAQLQVKGVPVFYVPYVKFPVDDRRSSGLLFPNIETGSENGLDFAQPIYWNIAPNYDATITPRYIEKRGASVAAELRHLSQWSYTEISGGYLANDKGGDDEDDIDPKTGLPRHLGEDRHLYKVSHNGGINQPWSTFLDLNYASDEDYIRDLGNLSQTDNSRTHLQRRASLGYQTEHWNYRLKTQDYQVITRGLADQYSLEPEIAIDGYYRFGNSLVLELKNRYSVFDHSDPNLVTGSRNRLDYSLSWDKRWTWGYIQPQANFKHISYSLDAGDNMTLAERSPSISVPVYSVDTGMFFERDFNWLTNFQQTLEPRLFYIKSDFENQSTLPDFDTSAFTPSYNQLFSDTRFSGGDRIADNNRLTIGLTSRFINKTTGQERFRVSVAQSIFYEDRRVTIMPTNSANEIAELTRDQSPLAIELAARFSSNWQFTGDIIYDDRDDEVDKASLGMRYNDNQNRLFNLTYRHNRQLARIFDSTEIDQDIEQVDISAFVPTGNNLNWVGRWNYDFTNDRELETFAGLEYNNCCWRASLVFRRWLDRQDEILLPEQNLKTNSGIFFQIQFKGLASVNSRVDAMLKNGIYGYEPLENF
jgi:LPS-assembly protein